MVCISIYSPETWFRVELSLEPQICLCMFYDVIFSRCSKNHFPLSFKISWRLCCPILVLSLGSFPIFALKSSQIISMSCLAFIRVVHGIRLWLLLLYLLSEHVDINEILYHFPLSLIQYNLSLMGIKLITLFKHSSRTT